MPDPKLTYHHVYINRDIAAKIDSMPWDRHEKTLEFRINASLGRFLDIVTAEPGLFKPPPVEKP